MKMKEVRSEGGTLRNLPVYLDGMEELGMRPATVAGEMAVGLAVAHWEVSIDMLDVEFVIGGRPGSKIIVGGRLVPLWMGR